jgi:succinate-semialdehyde dehydrogenase
MNRSKLTSRWNFPFAIALRKIAAAFAAGCTVVIKPSPETPVSTGALAVLVQRAGFAPGVMNIVTASTETTPTVGKSICEDPRIKKVSFTGSTAVSDRSVLRCCVRLTGRLASCS